MATGGGQLQMPAARSAAQAMIKKETVSLAFQKCRLYAGNPSPDRTPNATSKGAVGTDAAKTPEGTSDRTPTNPQKPSGN